MLSLLHSDHIRILQLLQHDARLTNKEIADKLGKSITPVYERIKKLESEGYIDRYVALLGQYDFLLKVAIQDMKEYQDVMMNKLAVIANIGTVQSFFVLTQSKQETAFALQVPARKKVRK